HLEPEPDRMRAGDPPAEVGIGDVEPLVERGVDVARALDQPAHTGERDRDARRDHGEVWRALQQAGVVYIQSLGTEVSAVSDSDSSASSLRPAQLHSVPSDWSASVASMCSGVPLTSSWTGRPASVTGPSGVIRSLTCSDHDSFNAIVVVAVPASALVHVV